MSTLQLSTLKPGRNLSLKGYSFNQIYTLTPTDEKDASIDKSSEEKKKEKSVDDTKVKSKIDQNKID